MSYHTTITQFFGGPLDGHLILTDPLPPVVVTFETALPRPKVSLMRRLVRLAFLDFKPNKDVVIVATYRLDRRCGRFGYVHAGSRRQTSQESAVKSEPFTSPC